MRLTVVALLVGGVLGCAGEVQLDERTLDSCDSTISTDAPDFFQSYFACVDISAQGDSVVIESDGLPPHRSYYYGEGHPNYEAFDYDRGEAYAPNPNRIAAQALRFEIPLEPTSRGIDIDDSLVDGVVDTSELEYPMGPVGTALDGVALFNPLAAPGDDIEAEKYSFDSYNAHPAPGGEYHYHTVSPGPLEVLAKVGAAEMEVFGVMCDGTLILGCTELDGAEPDDGDFDAQGGHVHDLVDGQGTALFTGRYHTHVCPGQYAFEFTPEIQYYDACVL